jgi:rubrerythrin
VNETPSPALIARLAEARAAEKAQALFYRAIAVAAEDRADEDLAERLNGLLADEQHHLSRLTVRLVEFGQPLEDLNDMRAPDVVVDGWEATARVREESEIQRYEELLNAGPDQHTRAIILEFLEAERAHARVLGGKWMEA